MTSYPPRIWSSGGRKNTTASGLYQGSRSRGEYSAKGSWLRERNWKVDILQVLLRKCAHCREIFRGRNYGDCRFVSAFQVRMASSARQPEFTEQSKEAPNLKR